MEYTQSIIFGSGYLNRIKLKEKDSAIYGYISIRTSSNNVVTFNVYQSEYTNSNKENPSYKCFKKVMSEYNDVTSGNPDYVEIKENEKYPNANIYINGECRKTLKFITRSKEKQSSIKFKIFGAKIISIDKKSITCDILQYNNEIKEMIFSTGKLTDFKIGDIIDITGWVIEGLYDGLPTDKFLISNTRLSEFNIDFSKGIKKQNNEDPF